MRLRLRRECPLRRYRERCLRRQYRQELGRNVKQCPVGDLPPRVAAQLESAPQGGPRLGPIDVVQRHGLSRVGLGLGSGLGLGWGWG